MAYRPGHALPRRGRPRRLRDPRRRTRTPARGHADGEGPVERAWGTVKNALAPLLDVTNRLADNVPALRRPDIARPLATLLVAVFLRVYAAGRRHLTHPLAGHDPDALRAIVEEQRDKARAEDRSVRLFLEAVHAEYAMPGSRKAFVRTFHRYPLEDLRDAERRFRLHACRCEVGLCDRYFAAVVRDAHQRGQERRRADRGLVLAAAQAHHDGAQSRAYFAELKAHPERRLIDALDVLADTWVPAEARFLAEGLPARAFLRSAVTLLHSRDPLAARDTIEAHARAWMASRPKMTRAVSDAVRGVLADVITEVSHCRSTAISPAAALDAMLPTSARSNSDNPRPTPPPHLRI